MYWRIDDGGRIERVGEAKPERWALGKSVVEETLETWLGLHLDTILGLPVHLARLTGPMSANEDIVAFDRVGRIHVFELKKGNITKKAAGQLEHYLLGRVWQDPDWYRRRHTRKAGIHMQPARVAIRLSGAYGGLRTSNRGLGEVLAQLGHDHPTVRQHLGEDPTKGRWRRLSWPHKHELFHLAYMQRASKAGLVHSEPSVDHVQEIAERFVQDWRSRFEDVKNPTFAVTRPLVMWLVGRRVNSAARKYVRRWRRAGLDARWCEAEIRRTPSSWLLRTRKEQVPQRTDFDWELEELAADNVSAQTGRLSLEIYSQAKPTDPSSVGGEPLEEPTYKVLEPKT